MSTIRVVYSGAPPVFPATDQHPAAVRYGPFDIDGVSYWADALGGGPTIDAIKVVIAPPRRTVRKSIVLSRLTDPQLDAVLAAMTPRQKERWRAPDDPTVFADDPEVLALVIGVGADPKVVLAP